MKIALLIKTLDNNERPYQYFDNQIVSKLLSILSCLDTNQAYLLDWLSRNNRRERERERVEKETEGEEHMYQQGSWRSRSKNHTAVSM